VVLLFFSAHITTEKRKDMAHVHFGVIASAISRTSQNRYGLISRLRKRVSSDKLIHHQKRARALLFVNQQHSVGFGSKGESKRLLSPFFYDY
jgi:hypothetical protein